MTYVLLTRDGSYIGKNGPTNFAKDALHLSPAEAVRALNTLPECAALRVEFETDPTVPHIARGARARKVLDAAA